jgi:hypothetical protein
VQTAATLPPAQQQRMQHWTLFRPHCQALTTPVAVRRAVQTRHSHQTSTTAVHRLLYRQYNTLEHCKAAHSSTVWLLQVLLLQRHPPQRLPMLAGQVTVLTQQARWEQQAQGVHHTWSWVAAAAV